MKKILLFGILVLGTFSSGCSELIDCIASTEPQLSSKSLRTGYVGQSYNDFIEGSIKNDPNDNAYDYFFSIDGNFPPGLTVNEQGNKLTISGAPTQSGTYEFRVSLNVDYPEYYSDDEGFWEDDNRFCFGDDECSKRYTITVQ